MPTEVDSSLNPNSAYYLSNNDLNTSKLVNLVFDGKCFNDWKRSMMIALSARNKLCFVDGTLDQPAANSQDFRIWNRCNDLVISWMLGSLEVSIARSVLYLKTTRDIWLDLEERFCQSSGPQLFSVQQKLCNCTLTQKLLKSQENQRLIQFLMKLNKKYDHSKSTILMMSPLPTISKAYGLLLQEEQQKEVNSNRNHNLESTVFTARKFTDNRTYKSNYGSNSGTLNTGGNQTRNFTYNRNNLFCEHCRMKNHTVDKCWKLHGYPKDFKGKGKRVAAAAQLEEFTEKESGNEKAANQAEHSGSGSLGLATTTQLRGTLCIFSKFKTKWILDSVASDHMCSNKSMFSKLESVDDKNHTITIPDGTELQDLSKNKHILLGRLDKGLYCLNEELLTSDNKTNVKGIDVKGCLAECFCQICPLAKQTRFPFSVSSIKSVQPFDLLHVDVWGPYSVHDSSRCNQFLTIVDDYTRMTWTHLMRNKTDSVKIMTDFLLYVENQFGSTVKSVRSDNAPDLTEGAMKELFLSKGFYIRKAAATHLSKMV
ncbi:uncharacterized protein [Spinacia oleracea]|uniref:Integrase catalytic domain-containing protein n=1 Tax=Spinacia oleracea TaxID=3562 RepID=A0A9R0JAH7_SPIOL|nr:uncharacterized protein LOC110801887 [Spinacia oleracea]